MNNESVRNGKASHNPPIHFIQFPKKCRQIHFPIRKTMIFQNGFCMANTFIRPTTSFRLAIRSPSKMLRKLIERAYFRGTSRECRCRGSVQKSERSLIFRTCISDGALRRKGAKNGSLSRSTAISTQ